MDPTQQKFCDALVTRYSLDPNEISNLWYEIKNQKENLTDKKVSDLKEMCKSKGLSMSGNKADLLQRLQPQETKGKINKKKTVGDKKKKEMVPPLPLQQLLAPCSTPLSHCLREEAVKDHPSPYSLGDLEDDLDGF